MPSANPLELRPEHFEDKGRKGVPVKDFSSPFGAHSSLNDERIDPVYGVRTNCIYQKPNNYYATKSDTDTIPYIRYVF